MISAIAFVKCLFQTSNLPMDTLDIAFFATGRSLAEIDNQGKGHNLFKSILSYEVDAWYEYWILKEIFVYIYIYTLYYIYNTHIITFIFIYTSFMANILRVGTINCTSPFQIVNCIWFVSLRGTRLSAGAISCQEKTKNHQFHGT